MSSGERQGYASELAGLWSDLARTLRRLDEIAADPEDALEVEELARLQYALHVFEKALIHYAALLVPGLPPRIGKIDMHRRK